MTLFLIGLVTRQEMLTPMIREPQACKELLWLTQHFLLLPMRNMGFDSFGLQTLTQAAWQHTQTAEGRRARKQHRSTRRQLGVTHTQAASQRTL
jgi:hypothetical protein